MMSEMKELRHDSSDFASSVTDKSDWDALKRCISSPDVVEFNDSVSVDNTDVSEVPTNRDIITAVSGHTVTVESNDETKIGTCEVESEFPIVVTKEALTAFKIVAQYYDTWF
jgi:hypothetical protein